MADFYINFPQRNTSMRDKFQRIEATTMAQARKYAYARWGLDWGFIYTAQEFDLVPGALEEFPDASQARV
jgi:hypothetical protein